MITVINLENAGSGKSSRWNQENSELHAHNTP